MSRFWLWVIVIDEKQTRKISLRIAQIPLCCSLLQKYGEIKNYIWIKTTQVIPWQSEQPLDDLLVNQASWHDFAPQN